MTKIVNVCIVSDLATWLILLIISNLRIELAAWLGNPTNNFKFKNFLFRATNIIKNSDKEKYVCSGYKITFDSAGSWSFDNDFIRNVIIFGVDNGS